MSKMVTNNGAARSMNGDHGTNGHEQGPMPIAVVGMSCRFPQAPDLKSFWQFMLAGGDAITEVPPERFDIEAVYDPRPATPGRIVTRYGGFLDGVDLFDAAFFGISPREAVRVDPQQRLLLEVSWEALEDAGIVVDTLEGSPTGVFVGMCYNDYEDLQISDPDSMDIYANTGGFRSVTPGRVSFALGLAGPSINVDAACASSLVSVHLACQSIRSGESTLAIAAGVNLILKPEISIGFSQAKMLSPDGRCKAFDSRANGFVRSEGIGVVVLKPLAEALADGNPIYAVIRSTMVNNDGRSNGMMTTPSRPGQQDLLRKAYHSAGINPADVQYIEAHGTGTGTGDPVEAGALGAVLGEGRSADQPCWLGSVKTNVGHTEGAAGIAGLIKLALSLKNGIIPASQHCLTPNPKIPWDELKLQVLRENSSWPQYGKPAIAGVNSFGISGINAHVVLEAPPTPTTAEAAVDEQPLLLPLSGRSPEALKAQAQSYRDFLTSDQTPALIDIVTTASRNRSHHAERVAIVGATRDELVAQLDMLLDGQRTSSMATSTATEELHPRVVFVCPGQGSQWPGMARLLLTSEPVFRQVIEECDHVMRAFVSWSLLELLEAEVPPPELERIDVIQPALFAMEVALGALWQSRGVRPDAVIGHSMGEVAAAYLAGILSLEDAARVICCRSQLMRRASGQGAMAVVDLAAPEAEAALAGFEDRLSVAVMNGPRSTVISGEPQALETVLTQLREQGVFCRHVKVDVASHSPQVDPLLDELAEVLAAVQPQAGEVPLYSTVQAEVIAGQTCTADYWVRNLRQPVRFGPTVQQLLTDGYTVFIELSPHPILLPSVEQGVQHVKATATLLAAMRRDEDGRRVLLEGMGRLWTQGYPIDWQLIVPAGGKIVPLPHYPWQRERFWLEASATGSGAARRPGASGHPLLGMYLQSSAQPEAHIWEAEFRSTSIPYLRDHQVQEMVVLPAAAYLELALAAAVAACGPGSHVVEQMSFNRMLVLNESTAQVIQVTLTTDGFGMADVQIASRPADADHAEPWVIHGRGSVRLVQEHPNGKHPQMIAYDAVQTRCTQVLDNTVMYQSLQERGYGYGPAFQGIAQVWTGGDEALAQLTPDIAQVSTDAYQVHPALLDSCFQALVAAVPNYVGAAAADQTYLPVMLQSLRVLASPSAACWSYVRFAPVSDPQANTIEGDVLVLAADGTVVVEAHGMRVQRMEPTVSTTSVPQVDEWLYNVQWQSVERPAATATPAMGTWLVFADRQGVAKSLRAQLKLQKAHVISVTPGATFQRLASDAYRINPSDPTSMQQLLVEVFGPDQPACQGIVHLWSLGMSTPTTAVAEELTSATDLGCISVMHLLQAINQANWPTAPRLWLVTAGSQQVTPEDTTVAIAQAPLWGLGRVIAYEHSDLRCTRIDLGATLDELTRDALFTEIWSGSSEEEIALRGSARYVARLSQYTSVETGATSDTTARVPAVVGQDALRLEVLTPGQLDSLNLRATTRPAPAPGQIEIQVRAAALNFLDVMRAMGIYPGQPDGAIPLGIECAGTVTAVGEGVEEFRVGDDVIAHAPTTNCTFSSFLLVQPAHAAPKPAQLSFEEAATLPVAFLTSYYALNHLAHMRAGERILIHSAAGGVGLAAIQIARWIGAEVFATAGTPEKRAFLKSLGVQYVFNSRSLDFADEVMAHTEGRGVDIVLNSLSGAAIPRSLDCLAPYGRFLEISKKDIYQNSRLGLSPFRRNLAYFAIDVDRAIQDRPDLTGPMLRVIAQHTANGTFQPLPHKVFPLDQAPEAFHAMARGQHIGKLVLGLQEQTVPVLPGAASPAPFRADGTYLITGGLGGLGLTVARWLVEQGARHLVLLGRRAPSAQAQETVAALRQAGAEVLIEQADVIQVAHLDRVREKIARTMPPLRGLFHAAGLLDDSTLLRQDKAQFLRAMQPKVHGAWNLHMLTQDQPLDHFVLFSSAAVLLGSPGQGNYVAGNAFMDALAHYRRAEGRPALSINWSPWTEVGLASAQDNRGARLAMRGMGSITPEQGIAALSRLIQEDLPQVGVMPFDAQQWCQFYPGASASSLLTLLLADEEDSDDAAVQPDTLRATLQATAPEQRREILETHLCSQIAEVLRLPQSRMNARTPLGSLGFDSLLALELRNRLEASLELTLPASLIWNYPSIGALGQHLSEKMGIELEVNGTSATEEQTPELSTEEGAELAELLGQLSNI